MVTKNDAMGAEDSFVEFSLSPLDEITPWGHEGSLSLSWFGFSLGRYRLKFGPNYLLNYSDDAVRMIAQQYPDVYPGPWVDYQIVRLWEDLMRLVPYAMRPVPDELLPLMRLEESQWRRWIAHARERSEAGDLDEEEIDVVANWRDERALDNGYLSPSSTIYFWQTGEHIEVRWDNAGAVIKGVPAWSATRGLFEMSTTAFLRGVQSFNDQFLSAMAQRVQEVCAGWARPDVRVDFAHLAHEHVERSGLLAKELARTVPEDVVAVLAAARAMLAVSPLPV